jgi:phenylacetate-coenzyme A ligase PaaK-like adenylate-forming protein
MIPPAFQTFDPLLEASAACEVAGAAALSADGMRCLQEARLRRLLRTACRDSAWYRHHLGGREPDRELRLQDLPVARKADLMAHFDQWVTDPVLSLDHLRRFTADRTRIGQAYGGRYVVWSSSGSSGEPGIFVQDCRHCASRTRSPTADGWIRCTPPSASPSSAPPGNTPPAPSGWNACGG